MDAMTEDVHPLSRLWLNQRRQDGTAHISLGCSHTWGKSLCGIPSGSLHSDEGASSVCPLCLSRWKRNSPFQGVSWMLPRGKTFTLLDASGALHRDVPFGKTERRARAITQDLHPLSPPSFGALGVMDVSKGHDGLLHGDEWCTAYEKTTVEARPISMGDDDVIPYCEGAPLHCQRRLPQDVEDGFFTALAVCRARNGLLSVMDHSGWGLFEAVRHEQGMHGTSDEFVCEGGVYEVRLALENAAEGLAGASGDLVALSREHERTLEVWNAVKSLMDGWGTSAEARAELGRATLFLSLASGNAPMIEGQPSLRSLATYGIKSGKSAWAALNVCQARLVGPGDWTSPLPATRDVVMNEVLPRLRGLTIPAGTEEEAVADLVDFMLTQDRALYAVAEKHMRESQVGVLLEVDPSRAPRYWRLWPQGLDEQGRTLTWVPSPVVESLEMEDLEASPAPFLPMTYQEAQMVLSHTRDSKTR